MLAVRVAFAGMVQVICVQLPLTTGLVVVWPESWASQHSPSRSPLIHTDTSDPASESKYPLLHPSAKIMRHSDSEGTPAPMSCTELMPEWCSLETTPPNRQVSGLWVNVSKGHTDDAQEWAPPPSSHTMKLGAHPGMQLPLEHFGTPLLEVMTEQVLPQVPQLLGSMPKLAHMFDAGQTDTPEDVLQVPVVHV